MDLCSELKTTFPSNSVGLTDEYIEKHPDPATALPAEDWLTLMPAYMSWCVRSPRRNEFLVLDHTIDALANFGRFHAEEPSHLNFRALCNAEQRVVVAGFLRWCLKSDVRVNDEQVERALTRWQADSRLQQTTASNG